MDSGIKGTVEMTPGQIRDALLSMPEEERKFIVTEPEEGEHKVYEVHLNTVGHIEGHSEDIPE